MIKLQIGSLVDVDASRNQSGQGGDITNASGGVDGWFIGTFPIIARDGWIVWNVGCQIVTLPKGTSKRRSVGRLVGMSDAGWVSGWWRHLGQLPGRLGGAKMPL